MIVKGSVLHERWHCTMPDIVVLPFRKKRERVGHPHCHCASGMGGPLGQSVNLLPWGQWLNLSRFEGTGKQTK